jgi:xylan 1,4-beta-xylosidase
MVGSKFLLGLIGAAFLTQFGASTGAAAAPATDDGKAHFGWLDYEGHDAVFDQPLGKDEYRNPVLTGFYPDPSAVRVGDDYYLINSTFAFYPGIPIFHSRDLVNWKQIGNVIDRPDMMPFDGNALGNNGVYAPQIAHHNGTFYVINTCVGCGGNFIVTAKNPAGPWSKPIWLPHIGGIDPSLFFDDDGKVYIIHQGNPPAKRYDAHTAIWLMEVDPVTFAKRSDDVVLVDGGDKAPWHTEYIEGPHLYKVNGEYMVWAAGGGTGYYHGELAYKSSKPFGPYTANPNNPVLTQFGLPDDRPNPVTATGHAELLQDAQGKWWAFFLGTRVYDLTTPPQDPGRFATGRETFMLPVTWRDGWPVVTEKGAAIPYIVKGPTLPRRVPAGRFLNGNYAVREAFTGSALGPQWLFARTPHTQWWQVRGGELTITPRSEYMGDKVQPSFVGRRLAHMTASITTPVRFQPHRAGDEAGLMAVQNDAFYYAFGLGLNDAGKTVLRIRVRAGDKDPSHGKVLAETPVQISAGTPIYLRMNVDKAKAGFSYSLDGKSYRPVLSGADASPLTTAAAGGFTGTVIGPYAETGAE